MELSVNLHEKSYKVHIEKGILNNVNNFIDKNKKVLIISDDGVPSSYIQSVKNQFPMAFVFVFPHGEKNKSLETYVQVLQYLIDNSFSKADYIIAVGGGVVNDLSGFVALTFKRGIHFVSIPTTTLSMVDASIGGKTALNFSKVKNVIGGYHHPDVVLIDPETLQTLPKRHFINGSIEALKVGILGDKELFDILKNTNFKENYEEVIYRALSYKIKIIEQDEHEEGVRKYLNFGHTFGHAIESYFAMKNSLHGEAIGLGMLLVSKDKPYYEDLKDLLKKWKVRVEVNVDEDKILNLIKNDKKCSSDMVDLVVVDDFSQPKIIPTPVAELRKYLLGEEK